MERNNSESIDAIAVEYVDYLNQSQSLADEIKLLQEKKKQIDDIANERKESLKSLLNGGKYENDRIIIKYRKSKVVQIENESEFCNAYADTNYVRTITTMKPNKKALRVFLESGETIDGVSLLERQNMVIEIKDGGK